MIQKFPLSNGNKRMALRTGDDLQRARMRLYRVEQIGRDLTYAYVSDSFKRHLRSDKHFRKWKRVQQKLTFASMDGESRRILQLMGEVVMAAKVDRANIGKIVS